MSTGGTRLLLAAGEAVADLERLPPLTRRLIATASDILVGSPVLVGRLRWLASDTDRARYEGDERLGVVLQGFHVPITAFESDRAGEVPRGDLEATQRGALR